MAADGEARRCCQVLGCGADLTAEGPYCVKRKCCSQHIRADFVQKDGAGGLHRFCFQCGRLEPIEYFDGSKRSCRARLQQRVKQVPKRRTTWTAGYNAGKKPAGQAQLVPGSHSCSSEAEAAAAADMGADPDWNLSELSRSTSCSQQKPKQRKKQQLKRPQRAEPMEEEDEEAAGAGTFDRLHELHGLQRFGSSFGVAGEVLATPGPYEASTITRAQSDACVPVGTQRPVVAAAAAGPAPGGDVAWHELLLQLCEAGSDKQGTETEDAAAAEDAAQLMALLDRELSAAAELARQSSMPAPSSSSSQNVSCGLAPAAPGTPALQLMAESSPSNAMALLQLQQEQQARQQQLQQLRLAKQAQVQLLQAVSLGSMPAQDTASAGLGSVGVVGAAPLELQQQQLAKAAQLMQQCQLMQQQQQQLLAGPMAATACLPQGHLLGAAAGVSATAGPATQPKAEDLEDRFAAVQTLLVKAQMLMTDITHCPPLLPMC